jgi:uncharacterized protein (TIGR02301 family)
VVIAADAAAQPQSAEDYRQRQQDLVELASVFGELHHIRRMCEPRFEGDVWRERMKKLVDLEQPQIEAREEMVKRFNAGYRNAGDYFDYCDRRARDHAAARALYAQRLIRRLSEPLEEIAEAEEESGGPLMFTIPQETD